MNLSEQTRIEAQIGFTIGIMVGAAGAWIAVLFLSPMAWYYKLFTSLGSVGILGTLYFSLQQQFQIRKIYLDTLKEMKQQ